MGARNILMAAAGVSDGTDPNFENVTLLLPGNGTNGAQNNTFLDSSTNNFTVTRNGNTTQGTFSPYGTLWSNYFDGNGDYLEIASSTAFDFGTGDFTIEAFVFPEWFSSSGTSSKGFTIVFGAGSNADGGGAARYNLIITWQGFLQFSNSPEGGANQFTVTATSNALQLNQWSHIAVVREGTTVRLFVNGTLCTVTGGTIGASVAVNRQDEFRIGRLFTSATFDFHAKGYISNIRVIKGTAVYTSSFTPPTAPLTAITNTSLLTCQGNRFRDASSNNFAITRNGDVSVQRFSPFEPAGAYDPAVIGGSGYFDGAGDYLSVANNAALNLASGNFTIEAFLFPTTLAKEQMIAVKDHTFGSTFWSYRLSVNTSGKATISLYDGAGAITPGYDLVSDQGVTLNQWNHIAATRSGTTVYIFVNGIGKSGTQSGTQRDGGKSVVVGRIQTGASTFDDLTGYLSSLRIVKGTAVYTSNFAPPTSPLTAITNTSLLLGFTNAGIIDNAMMNNFETAGTAQVSTTQSKWGGSSIFLNGAGNYLLGAPAARLFSPGAGNFTVEYWCYPTTVGGSTIRRHFSMEETSNALVIREDANIIRPFFRFGSTTVVTLDCSVNFTADVWQHIALVRNGNVFTLYKDGVSVGSITNSGAITLSTASLNISTASESYSGYVDDLRFTRGVARYTANFTPPSGPFELF